MLFKSMWLGRHAEREAYKEIDSDENIYTGLM